MLSSSKEDDKQACVKCLQLLTNNNRKYWQSILDAGGIDRLCDILKKYALLLDSDRKKLTAQLETITLNAISVLCNLSDQPEIKEKLSEIKDLTGVFIKILSNSTNEDIQSRVSILIADISSIDDQNKTKFAQQGCIGKLLELLDRNVEDLLVNTVNAIEIVCLDNVDNQNFCANNGVFLSFIDLLDLNSGLKFLI